MKKYLLITLPVSCFLAYGCYYHVEEELYGVTTCDSSSVTYSITVNNILNNYSCISCHNNMSSTGGVNLEGYFNVKARVIDNRLLGSITHAPGFSPMPLGRTKMEICDINKIKRWIDAGAPNN